MEELSAGKASKGKPVDERDRRSYSRMSLEIKACVFFKQISGEVPCRIRNISEKGLSLEVEPFEGDAEHLIKGNALDLQFVDNFTFGRDVESDVINIRCVIRHVEREDGIFVLGCYVSSADYERYVRHREVSGILGNS